MLRQDYAKSHALLKRELTAILEQFEDVKTQLAQREKQLLVAYDKMEQQEIAIMELQEYARNQDVVQDLQDQELAELNDGNPAEKQGKLND